MTAKSHHYNPQVYMRQFKKTGKKNELWQYDLTNGTANKSTPQESGCEDFYHSFICKDGKQDNESIEKSFHFIENRLPELFKAIRCRMSLSPELWRVFFLFAAIQHVRCPKALHSFNESLSRQYKYEFEIMKSRSDFDKTIINAGLDPQEFHETEFDVKADRGTSLLMLLSRYPNLEKLFSQMNWVFFCAPSGKYFFTSDAPVCSWSPPEKRGPFGVTGLADANVEITFPLSKSICAFGQRQSPPLTLYQELPDNKVHGINYRTVCNGWHFVYGPTEDVRIMEIVEAKAESSQNTCQPIENN